MISKIKENLQVSDQHFDHNLILILNFQSYLNFKAASAIPSNVPRIPSFGKVDIDSITTPQGFGTQVNNYFENLHQRTKERLGIYELKYEPVIDGDFDPDNILQYVTNFVTTFDKYFQFSKNDQSILFRILISCLCDIIKYLVKYIIKKQQVRKKTISSPLPPFLYQKLMLALPNQNYPSKRLRVMIFLLVLTGIRIYQLRSLKVSQLKSVLNFGYQHLTTEGQTLWKEREKDFESLLKDKDSNSYLFTAKPRPNRPNRPLTRESITRDINKVLKQVSRADFNDARLTSYSIRMGYTDQFWKTPEKGYLVKKILTKIKD